MKCFEEVNSNISIDEKFKFCFKIVPYNQELNNKLNDSLIIWINIILKIHLIVSNQLRHYMNGLYSLIFTSVKLNTIKMLRMIMVVITSNI